MLGFSLILKESSPLRGDLAAHSAFPLTFSRNGRCSRKLGSTNCQQSVSSLESHIAREHHAVGLSKHPEVTEQARWQNRRRSLAVCRRVHPR